MVWGGAEIALRQGVAFVISILLARLLTPEDFGVLAMLSIFIGVAGVFVDIGFGSALIQKNQITTEDTSSVFYFNIASAMAMAVLLVVAAPWIAQFYRMPILKPLTWLMALNLFLGSFRSVQGVLMTKSLNFRTQMKITLIASVISGTVGVFLAWRGLGVWSLAIQTVVSTFVGVLLFWILSPWRPALVFSMASLRSLFRYGSFMALSGILDTAYTRLNTLIIGRFYSARELGIYSRADHIQHMPTGMISALFGRVAFPVFSAAAARGPQELRRAASKAVSAVMFINTPIMFGILASAQHLVHVAFGEQWLSCVPLLQVLCLAGVFWPLHVINLNLIKGCGRSDLFFRLEVIKKVLGLVVLLLAARISIMAMAWGQVFVGFACYFVNSFYSGQLAHYPAKAQLKDILPCAAIASIMLFTIWSLPLLLSLSPPVALMSQVALGATLYLLLCVLFRIGAFYDVTSRLRAAFAQGKFTPVEA